MANTYVLGGSPLGLIGVRSRPSRDGMSTFNAGRSRNVNVIQYNSGERAGGKKGKDGAATLFTASNRNIKFFPNINKTGTDADTSGAKDDYKGIVRTNLHNNDIYDTSNLNIIEKLSSLPSAALRPQDFAYLKQLGVFPNNRLVIARKFNSPIDNNLLTKKGPRPRSVLISWRPQGEQFLSFSFGEEWMDADADFTGILNKLGADFGLGKGAGDFLGGGGGLTPLPGFPENLQRDFLEKLGILEKKSGIGEDGEERYLLPAGDPNLIKEAKRRKLINYGDKGSGLKCKIDVKFDTEYEQKFISGIDPTIAWMDIIYNILSFGTQEANKYGLSKKFTGMVKKAVSNPSSIITDITKAFKEILDEYKGKIGDVFKDKSEKDFEDGESKKKEKTSSQRAEDYNATQEVARKAFKSIADSISNTIEQTIRKYEIEVMGIAHALSGLPSGPYHVTIGNPLRPMFSCGDMIVEDVTLELGSTLAFNDLPVNIKTSFTMTNARPLGLEEIFARFNSGHLRTVNENAAWPLDKDNNLSEEGTEREQADEFDEENTILGESTDDSSTETAPTSNIPNAPNRA